MNGWLGEGGRERERKGRESGNIRKLIRYEIFVCSLQYAQRTKGISSTFSVRNHAQYAFKWMKPGNLRAL